MDAQSTILIPPREGSERNEKKIFEKFATRRFVRVANFSQRFPRGAILFPQGAILFPQGAILFPQVPKK